MTSTFALEAIPVTRLDYGLVSRVLLMMGFGLVLLSPLSPDSFAFAAGAFVPWIAVQIVTTPTMPAPIVYWLLWQWLQTFARVVVTAVDGLSMSRSVFGPSVESAYWYDLAGIIVLAVATRAVLGNIRPNNAREVTWHLTWRPIDLFVVYVASFALSIACSRAVLIFPTLYQQIDAVAKFKTAAAFMLFASVLTTGRGYRLALMAIGMELVMGFTGLLSDFRGVFIVLIVAALAVRVRFTGTAAAAGAVWVAILIALSLFWTAIKMDYRDFATGVTGGGFDDETQAITASFEDRIGYIGGKTLAVGEIDWNVASYDLLTRLAYVDLFGAVIGVNQFFGGDTTMRQWSDALSHVFQPRFLFPDKATLSDSEVYMRLTRADPTEQLRLSTSISVGYMAENYADLGFPGMLIGVFVVGMLISGVVRYFMSTPLPWMVRQSIVMAFIYAAAGTGIEISLPKTIGTAVMFFIVYATMIKVSFPAGLRWLDMRAKAARHLEENIRRAAEANMSRTSRP